MNRRESLPPVTLSEARIRVKKAGGWKPGYSFTAVDSSQNRMEGTGQPLVYRAL